MVQPRSNARWKWLVVVLQLSPNSPNSPKPVKSRRPPRAGNFFDTGVVLVTDKPVDGFDQLTVQEGKDLCWG